MKTFNDLPNELVVEIWGHVVEPEGVESFALVSKRIFGLAAPFITEHARLKQQYSTLCYPGGETGRRAAVLLETMLLNPRVALYVNELLIRGCAGCWAEQRTPHDSSWLSRDTVGLFKDAVTRSCLFAPSEVERWGASMESGDEDPILALILMQLTRLKKFELSLWDYESDRCLLEAFGRITQSSEAAIPSGLPTVASKIDRSDRVGFPESSPFAHVSDVTLNFCDWELEDLSQLLRSTRALESFSYYDSGTSYVEMSQVCDELLKYSQHSLQKLCLTSSAIEQGPIRDLSRFKLLAEIKIDFLLLLGSTEGKCPRLTDILPMSIERVTLISLRGIAFEAHREAVLQMIQAKMKRLSNLKALTFETWQVLDPVLETKLDLMVVELGKKSAELGFLLSVDFSG